MHNKKQAFIQLAITRQVLRFGEFTLKSGRISPYFFNAGLFHSGAALSSLANYYADAIVESGLEFDMLFGPAYKGIPLATATAVALAQRHQRDYPWCFNRKEAKQHGEGGQLVGAPLQGRVLVIDDVITAGTAINESYQIITAHRAEFAGVVIAIDRQEKGQGDLSAVQEVEQRYRIPVISVASLSDIIDYLADEPISDDLQTAMLAYRQRYGV